MSNEVLLVIAFCLLMIAPELCKVIHLWAED